MRANNLVLAVSLTVGCGVGVADVSPGSFRWLYDLEHLPDLKRGVCRQASSYDRTGGNDDGFSGKYSVLRVEGNERVIFDEKGPG
ncbi:MAG: hypothetical protein ACE5O2_12045, partial [Armatimonadota bacterium]